MALSILGVVLLLYGLLGLGIAWYGYSTTQQVLGQVRSTADGLKLSGQQASPPADRSISGATAPLASFASRLSSLVGGRAADPAASAGGNQEGPALLRVFDQQLTGLLDQVLALADRVAATITLLVAWQAIHAVVSLLMGGVILSRVGRSAPGTATVVQAPYPSTAIAPARSDETWVFDAGAAGSARQVVR